MKPIFKLSPLFIATSMLIACGGGGSTTTPPDDNSPITCNEGFSLIDNVCIEDVDAGNGGGNSGGNDGGDDDAVVDSIDTHFTNRRVAVDSSIEIEAIATFDDGTVSRNVTLKSRDTDIAKIENGKVVGVSEGMTTIIVSKDGEEASINVEVVAKADSTTPVVYDGIKIYFKGASHLWAWKGAQNFFDTWPGKEITDVNDGWKTHAFPGESELSLILSNDGAKLFEEGIEIKGKGEWYFQEGKFVQRADGALAPVENATVSIDEVKTDDVIEITLTGSGTDVELTYSINGDPTLNGAKSFTSGEVITLDADSTIRAYALGPYGDATAEEAFGKSVPGSGAGNGGGNGGENPVTDENFTWDNLHAYFVITDRFYNADKSNDESYGRKKSYGSDTLDTGTFHGGDIAGLTKKLKEGYFTTLGINAIWVTAPYEQAHGWAGGGDPKKGNGKTFPHYAYHGYYPLDFTTMDKNMGTVEEFREFVNTAHSQGIRILMDVVMNHVGYATLADMKEYNFGGFAEGQNSDWEPSNGMWNEVWKAVDWDAQNWENWWGFDWVAAGLPGHEGRAAGSNVDANPIQSQLNDLPDVKTEVTKNVDAPKVLQTKWNKEKSGYNNWIVPAAKDLRQNLNDAPAEYITKWLSAWVEEFGIDGFRVDTVKHVENYRWAELKNEASSALKKWRQNNPDMPGADWTTPFWTTGEVWNYGANKGNYHTEGKFDSIINFNFPKDGNLNNAISTWAKLAGDINSDSSWNTLSYLNSHDAKEFGGWVDVKMNHATYLVLSPGGVQTYYGDEVSRNLGPEVSDPNQNTRSDYPWTHNEGALLKHYQKLGQFRRNNPAVGAGKQDNLGNNTVKRTYKDNTVVIAINQSGTTDVSVAGAFENGDTVRNAYTGKEAEVKNGKVSFSAENGVILIEAVQ